MNTARHIASWVTSTSALKVVAAAFLASSVFYGSPAAAQTCGTDYTVKEGESLAGIARKIYGNTSQWTVIFYANQDRIGANASLLVPGLVLRVPCVGQEPEQQLPQTATVQAAPSASAAPDRFILSNLVKRIEFLTAEGYAPLTGRALPNGGMVTHLVSASMDLIKEQSEGRFDYGISWVNDWSAHLNPLLSTRAFDVGFPWIKPDCSSFLQLGPDAKYKCQKFFFSDPLYEIVEVIYVKEGSSIQFDRDDDIIGKTVCITVEQGEYDLNRDGRNWVKDDKVTLMRPPSLKDCFGLLQEGTVDAVIAPSLTGQATATALGIADEVSALPRPLAIQTVHAIVAKTHPHARTLLYYINSALAKLKESGEHDRLIETHLSQFWATYDPDQAPVNPQPPTRAPDGRDSDGETTSG